MSKPAIVPETTASGIALDPRTLERVIPESRRPDGSYVLWLYVARMLSDNAPLCFAVPQHDAPTLVRKQIKIRPGYTPQEDVRRFR
ncbi:hypothetical protein V8D89_013934, partial [Ganoderma adspersum]